MIQRKITFSIHKVILTCLGGPFFSGHGVVTEGIVLAVKQDTNFVNRESFGVRCSEFHSNCNLILLYQMGWAYGYCLLLWLQ